MCDDKTDYEYDDFWLWSNDFWWLMTFWLTIFIDWFLLCIQKRLKIRRGNGLMTKLIMNVMTSDSDWLFLLCIEKRLKIWWGNCVMTDYECDDFWWLSFDYLMIVWWLCDDWWLSAWQYLLTDFCFASKKTENTMRKFCDDKNWWIWWLLMTYHMIIWW